jgi:hypothetical protein
VHTEKKMLPDDLTPRHLLDVIPLVNRLSPEDREGLTKDFPEFDLPALLNRAGLMGSTKLRAPKKAIDEESVRLATPPKKASEDEPRRLRNMRFEVQLAQTALKGTLPRCEKTWRALGKRLRGAAQMEFYSGLLALLGGGGAAGGAALGQFMPATIAGGLAFVAAALSLYSQFQRRSLKDDVSVGTAYGGLAEARGKLLRLKDSLGEWATASDELLLDNEPRVLGQAGQAVEVVTAMEDTLSAIEPLVT